MESDEKFLEFLDKDAKATLLYIKKNIKIARRLLAVYLEDLPEIRVSLVSSGLRSTSLCNIWFTNLREDLKLHCEHCKQIDDCSFECVPVYEKFMMSFCDLCTASNKEYCLRSAIESIKSGLKGEGVSNNSTTGGTLYRSSCGFPFSSNRNKYSSFVIATFVLSVPSTHATVSQHEYNHTIANQLQKLLILRGIPLNTHDIGERSLTEAGLTIVTLTYLFLKDLLNRTVYLGISTNDDHNDYESSNVVAAQVFKKSGLNDEDIEKALNSNINPDELVIGRKSPTSTSAEVSGSNIIKLIDSIYNIYAHELLPNVTVEDVRSEFDEKIEYYVSKDRFRVTNVEWDATGAYRNRGIAPGYIQYVAYMGLMGLVKAVELTRFTTKTPKLFTTDYLLRLRNILRAQYKSNEQRELQNRVNVKDACKDLKIGYSAVHEAIKAYIDKHPRYVRAGGAKNRLNRYGFAGELIALSTKKELEEWKKAVNHYSVTQ